MTNGGMSLACEDCGKVRNYNAYQVKRGHARKICQKCAVKRYSKTLKKKTKEEKAKQQAEFYQKNKVKYAKYMSEYREKIRLEMIKEYGGKCNLCEESDPVVLVLDHINNDAKEDRKKNKHNGGYKMYLFLRRNQWPKDNYMLLCHNCNFRKEYFRRKDAVKNR